MKIKVKDDLGHIITCCYVFLFLYYIFYQFYLFYSKLPRVTYLRQTVV